MKEAFLKIIFLLFAVVNVQGQPHEKPETVDSLLLLLEQPKVDSLQVEVLMELATFYNSIDKLKTIDYYLQALSYDMRNHSKARILNGIGFNYWKLGKFNKANEYYGRSLSLFKETNDSTRTAMVTNNIAAVQWSMGKWNEALQSYDIALKIRKALNEHKGVSDILNNIGLIYQDFGVYNEALNYHHEALKIASEIKNTRAITYSYSNIGICYRFIKEAETALDYHFLSYKIYNETKNDGVTNAYFLSNIGMDYRELGKIDSALYYFTQSLEAAKKSNNEHRVAIAENQLGEIQLQLGEFDLASKYINSSLHLALNNSYPKLIRDNNFALAEIEESKGNTNLALTYYKNATILKDSLINKEELGKFTELTIGQTKEKEKIENLLLKENIEIQKEIIREEKITLWALLAGFTILLAALIYIIKSRESIKKLNSKLLISAEGFKQSNATKDQLFSIIAHDLRSPFTSIIGLSNLLDVHVKNKNIEDIATYSSMISDLSHKAVDLISNLMEWALSQTGKIKFAPKRLNINVLINENEEFYQNIARQKSITIINNTKGELFVHADNAMTNTVLRNLLSNAIKFTAKEGSITLSSEEVDEGIMITISDTGIGMNENVSSKLFEITNNFTTKGTLEEIGSGFGLVICKEFIDHHQGKIWVTSEPNKGSNFFILLPHNNNVDS